MIREREGGEKAIVVGHSASQTEVDKEEGRTSGQDLFWVKPPHTGGEMLQDVMRLWGEKRGGRKRTRSSCRGACLDQLG